MYLTNDRRDINRHKSTRAHLVCDVMRHVEKIQKIDNALKHTPRFMVIKRYHLERERKQLVAIIDQIKVEIDRIDTTIANIQAWATRP